MGISFYLMLGSGLGLIVLFLLFKAEAARGRRLFLGSFRDFLDLKLRRQHERWDAWKQYVGASSFRLFMHYVLHQLLGSILYLTRKLESGLSLLRKHNREIAKDVKNTRSDNHLSHIAVHKANVALSEDEKRDLKHRSLHH